MTLPTTRRVVIVLAAAACALAPHALSVVGAQAALVAATTSVSQQDGGGNPGDPLPAIVCEIPSVGDALSGQAVAVTTVTCSGVEDEVDVTATWTDLSTNTVLSSDSQTITSPTTNYERQDSMSRGTPGARQFHICITVHAIGFFDDSKCNTLTGL